VVLSLFGICALPGIDPDKCVQMGKLMQEVSPRKLGTRLKSQSQADGEHDLIPLGFVVWEARYFDSIVKIPHRNSDAKS